MTFPDRLAELRYQVEFGRLWPPLFFAVTAMGVSVSIAAGVTGHEVIAWSNGVGAVVCFVNGLRTTGDVARAMRELQVLQRKDELAARNATSRSHGADLSPAIAALLATLLDQQSATSPGPIATDHHEQAPPG